MDGMDLYGGGLGFCFALARYGIHGSGDRLLVAEVVAFDRLEIFIQLVNEGNAGRDVELEDLLFGEVIEVFDQGAKAVPVSGDDDAFAGLHSGCDFFVPERKKALDGILEALGEGKLGLGNAGVAGIVSGPTLVGFFQWGWGDVVTAAPDEDLFVTKLRCGFGFIETLECSIMALVEAPVFFHWDPELVEFREDAPERVEGAFENGNVGDIEAEALFFEQFAGSLRFCPAFVAEFDVVPTSKAVFFVPGAFAVADEDKFIHSVIFSKSVSSVL